MKVVCIVLAFVFSMPLVVGAEFTCSEFFADGKTLFLWQYSNTKPPYKQAKRHGRLLVNNGKINGVFGPWRLEGSYGGAELHFVGRSNDHNSDISGKGKCDPNWIHGEFGYVDGHDNYEMWFIKEY